MQDFNFSPWIWLGLGAIVILCIYVWWSNKFRNKEKNLK